jgi:hypothetical protein
VSVVNITSLSNPLPGCLRITGTVNGAAATATVNVAFIGQQVDGVPLRSNLARLLLHRGNYAARPDILPVFDPNDGLIDWGVPALGWASLPQLLGTETIL